jgi:hypothetical protein
MLFLALANVMLSYYMAIGRRSFLYVLIACSVLQIGLIAVWHGSPGAIVQVVVAVMFMLLVGMSVPLLPRFGGGGLVA